MVYFSIIPSTFPEIIFAHQFAQENYHHNFVAAKHNIEIAYVKAGTLLLTIEGQEYRAEEGSFLLLPRNYTFSVKALDKLHIHYTLTLHISSDITLYHEYKDIPEDDSLLVLPVMLPPCIRSDELFHRLNHVIEEHHKSHSNNTYKCACKAFELLCDISDLSKTISTNPYSTAGQIPQIYCRRIKDYVQKNLKQPITLSDLSVFLEKNTDYLNRIFKAETGITIKQYINQEKIKKCVELMTTQGLSLIQCCEHVGIKDPNYLSRMFKKQMGISVAQFKLNSVYSTFPLVDKDRL